MCEKQNLHKMSSNLTKKKIKTPNIPHIVPTTHKHGKDVCTIDEDHR